MKNYPEIRQIHVDLDNRVETGPTAIGDDWPGVFIRGDNAMGMIGVLNYLRRRSESGLPGKHDSLNQYVFEELIPLLESCLVEKWPPA